ncbi:MAG: stage sporulation protein [Tepidanaerobacteraceae bacterium]|nr:stage sporulation protein [Tepidanaerobacteraceae bacterium]
MAKESEMLSIKLYNVQKQEARIMGLEEYVVGAVAASMPAEFPREALKAQAICCRTLAAKRMRIFGGSGCRRQQEFDVCSDSNHCQGFLDVEERQKLWQSSYEEYSDKIHQAVEETREMVLLYNDRPIEAVFHPACGGYTEDSENVWGNRVSYLRRVECIYCKDSPYWKTTRTFSIKTLKKKLGINFDDNQVDKKEIPGLIHKINSTAAGRIKSIKIGDMLFDGDEVRNLLNLPSTRFAWKVSSICFQAMGLGHGLGMCQHGARGMALLGFPVDEILKFYFTGVEIGSLEKPTISKPLKGKVIVLDPGHGGDSGSTGPMGLSEGYVNLEIAKVLAECLEREGAAVYLTRDKNEFKSLAERVRLSNQIKPDITVSIHQNVFNDDRAGGTETFYYPGDAEGKRLAEHIQRNLVCSLMLCDLGAKEADLYVLRETNNPSVLVNVAFLSNPEEEKLLSEPEFRHRAAAAIIEGIVSYYQK